MVIWAVKKKWQEEPSELIEQGRCVVVVEDVQTESGQRVAICSEGKDQKNCLMWQIRDTARVDGKRVISASVVACQPILARLVLPKV